MYQEEYLENQKNIIKIQYNDNRKIIGKAKDEIQEISKKHAINADIFETEKNELISHSFQDKDFDKDELEKYKKYGEELYEKSSQLVSIYITCSPHVKIMTKRDEIQFKRIIFIKITKIKYSDTYDIFRYLTELVKNRVKFDKEDLFALSMIPKMGPPEDLRYMRIECLKLWKEINKKGLIK